MSLLVPYEKSKSLGSGGSMVERLLIGILFVFCREAGGI